MPVSRRIYSHEEYLAVEVAATSGYKSTCGLSAYCSALHHSQVITLHWCDVNGALSG